MGKLLAGDFQQGHDILAGFGVQVAGGLVGQDDGGLGRQGPGDGHPLLLAAGEVVGQVPELFLQAQSLDDLVHVGGVGLLAVQLNREDDVLIDAEDGDQVVVLEDEADLPPPEDGQGLVLQGEDVLSVHGDGAGGGPVQAAQHVEEGGLAGAGGADHGGEFALFHRQVHAVQGADLRLAGAVVLVQGLCL